MPMDDKALTALLGSIAKWEAILNNRGKDDGMDNCPLCKEFYKENPRDPFDDTCAGCPVAEKHEENFCAGTPYIAWARHQMLYHKKYNLQAYKIVENCPECISLATEELNFLKSLLPNN